MNCNICLFNSFKYSCGRCNFVLCDECLSTLKRREQGDYCCVCKLTGNWIKRGTTTQVFVHNLQIEDSQSRSYNEEENNCCMSYSRVCSYYSRECLSNCSGYAKKCCSP